MIQPVTKLAIVAAACLKIQITFAMKVALKKVPDVSASVGEEVLSFAVKKTMAEAAFVDSDLLEEKLTLPGGQPIARLADVSSFLNLQLSFSLNAISLNASSRRRF